MILIGKFTIQNFVPIGRENKIILVTERLFIYALFVKILGFCSSFLNNQGVCKMIIVNRNINFLTQSFTQTERINLDNELKKGKAIKKELTYRVYL